MLKEFRDFAIKGNVIDLAIGVIIGAAFGTIVSSLVDDVFMPVIGLTDDAAVIATATKLVWDQIKPEHRDAAREALERMNKSSAA